MERQVVSVPARVVAKGSYMPINPEVVGARSEPVRREWSATDSLIYALGVGAGVTETQFTTENSANVTQRVLPTQAVVLRAVGSSIGRIGTFNPALLVHGEEAITVHREIPPAGAIDTVSEITGIWDKGSGALVEITGRANLVSDGQPLFDVVTSLFLRGEGGWGGPRGSSGPRNVAPDRAPDHTVTYQTRDDQALLYRLSGDRNPLHSDPAFAAMAGFGRPILHGLCTYGFAGRALLHTLCDSDPAAFGAMEARFTSPVFPGERLTVVMWEEPGGALFQTLGDDGRVVIDSGRMRRVGQ